MLTVEAVDSDKGVNDLVLYSISSEYWHVPRAGLWARGRWTWLGLSWAMQPDALPASSPDSTRVGWFDIGVDGVIRVSGPLDREQLLQEDEEVQLQVTVSEGSTAP